MLHTSETVGSKSIVTGRAAICRDIELTLVGDRHHRGSIVRTQPIPENRIGVADFVSVILPGHEIEHLGRTQMLRLGYKVAPSSLFFAAVHECFSKHHPLALRPEVLMFLIAHEIATTVKLHAEHYRALFTTSDEVVRIDVRHDGLRRGDPLSPWQEAIPMFRDALEARVPGTIIQDMLPELSTSSLEADVASLIAFMDAASPFYDYHAHTMCGIPQIRLLGEPSDYDALLSSAQALAPRFSDHLGPYFTHLMPVLEVLADQAHGASLDEHFWSSIYKHASMSGTDNFNGWLTAFVNYVQDAPDCRGGKAELRQKDPELFDWANQNSSGWCMPGLALGSVPSQISKVPFTWHYFGTTLPMFFLGGVLGVDNDDGYVTPNLSYAVVHALAA